MLKKLPFIMGEVVNLMSKATGAALYVTGAWESNEEELNVFE
jgi:hypothetical protein